MVFPNECFQQMTLAEGAEKCIVFREKRRKQTNKQKVGGLA